MELYRLLESYSRERRLPSDPDSATPELGQNLSLFHACLIEAGMLNEQVAYNFPLVSDRNRTIAVIKILIRINLHGCQDGGKCVRN